MSEIDWNTRAFNRDRSMWWRLGKLLEKAALHHADQAVRYASEGDKALMLAEAASYANQMATGALDWTVRDQLFRRGKEQPA